MKLSQRKVKINSEKNWDQIWRILTEKGIPFSVMESSSSNPNLTPNEFLRVILIDDVYSSTVLGETNNLIETEMVANSSTNKKRTAIFFLAIYSLAITMIVLHQNLFNYSEYKSKNFLERYSSDNRRYEAIHIGSGIQTLYFDENLDGNRERIESYLNGRLYEQYFDENENGLYEMGSSYNATGTMSEYWVDKRDDGIYDKHVITLKTKKSPFIFYYVFSDTDDDGQYDQVVKDSI